MSLSKSTKKYMGVRAILPPDLVTAKRAPTSGDKAYIKGTIWMDTVGLASYMWPGSGSWISLGSGALGGVVTLTASSGGAISPSGGDIHIVGTANQITTAGAGHTITFTLPVAITAPGSITSTTTISSGSSIGSTTTITAGTGITATTGNIVASAGNISAILGSVTAATTLTATLGAITATNGNLVLVAAGNKIMRTSVATIAAAGANSIGSVTLVGGTATVATTSVTANSLIKISRQSIGATGAAILGHLSVGTIVASTSFVINALSLTDATALQTSDVSVIFWEIVN